GGFVKKAPKALPLQMAPTGNAPLDQFVEDSQVLLMDLTIEAERINDPLISEKTEELTVLCRYIFSMIVKQPEKLSQIRMFMNYYLPTAANLLRKYREMKNQPVREDLLQQTYQQLLQALDLIIPACEKQLKALHQDDILDMRVDVEVLEKILKKDGLLDSDLSPPCEPPPSSTI
ncbi:MAG: hypothetical protein GX786_09470, partial [Clostridiales bacterium]|nr:hypothetical protein [Clostridiales bacterium]